MTTASTRAAEPSWTLTTLHGFRGGADGDYPYGAPATDRSGALYGTTSGVGHPGDEGTVYRVKPGKSGGWSEDVLLQFPGGAAGADPLGGVTIGKDGVLYGTTTGGGTGDGIVFALLPPTASGAAWQEQVLHSFGAGDGTFPTGDLLADGSGRLFGVTSGGGTKGHGTVWRLDPPKTQGKPWHERILYSFGTGARDGSAPLAGLVPGDRGTLFGTTEVGGDPVCDCGTVFELTPSDEPEKPWTETILHRFTGKDGSMPQGRLVMDRGGALYGVTPAGGAFSDGTIFALTPTAGAAKSWHFAVLHSFAGSKDAAEPAAGLILGEADEFYGTSLAGGSAGLGTVYRLKPPAERQKPWSVAVLKSFDGTDGEVPLSSLLMLHGALYGTTFVGGPGGGFGTLFELARDKSAIRDR
jgi:uncharacterized repeat protein (TIGR03803 family)